MTNLGIAERLDHFLSVVGITHEADWLHQPATEPQLDAVAAALGYELPADLRELLAAHDGGRFFDYHDWIGCANHDTGVVRGPQNLALLVGEFRAIGPPADSLLPGPRTLLIAAASHVAILYDIDDRPGRLLYMDTIGSPPIVPLARDLASLIDAYLELAEAGYIEVQPLGPFVTGPVDDVRAIYLAHDVAAVPNFGIDNWLNWEGSAGFTLD